MDRYGKKDAAETFRRLKSIMDDNRDELTRLDSLLGDGDLGLTMTKAFSAVDRKKEEFTEKAQDPGKMFMLAGMEIGREAPSTMGTLLAAGFMRAGKAVTGKDELTAEDISRFFRIFSDAIADLGKAKAGDKTILDVLLPAADALETAGSRGVQNIGELLTSALSAAIKGREESKAFMAKHGRPGIFREKTIGLTDPGAATGVLLIQAFQEAST